jgi:hypothetical protein
MNTRNLVRTAVRAILEKGEHYPWQKQGLGMLRLYLSPETRLHVWDSRLRVPDVSTIHDHPWDFRSYVVAGSLVNVRFRRPANAGEIGSCSAHAPNVAFCREYRVTRIRCGPGGCAVDPPTPERLHQSGTPDSVRVGGWYEQRADEIHESRPADGTVTLVERHFRADTEHANVYHLTPTWVSAEPSAATWDEAGPIVRDALARWDA